MTEPTEPRASGAPPDDALAALRGLLFSAEQAQLESLRQRVEDPVLRAQDVGRVLAEAVSLRAAEGPELRAALTPAVESAITSSIRSDPGVLADSMYPIIGPAIRKSIAAALQDMTQALDQAIAHSFTLQGLKWRLEARRSGRPFAEVVLLHTLLYRVEQVFLIDRRNGLLIQHVVAPDVAAQDAGMVSGMLTAIQDFVRDSFGHAERETLDSLQVGEVVVWIEQGPLALLAAVIRGEPPRALRDTFRQVLEQAHRSHGGEIEAFDGDTDALESLRPALEACLVARYAEGGRAGRRKLSPATVIAALLALVIVVVLALRVRDGWRRDAFVERLRAEPGLVVTEAGQHDGRLRVTGLRDTLAADPAAWLGAAGLEAADVSFNWEPYLSLRPEFVVRRALAVLAPPPGVSLQLVGNTLVAEGLAPRLWLQGARQRATAVPGVGGFDGTRVVVAEAQEAQALRERLLALVLRSDVGAAGVAAGQDAVWAQLEAEVRRLGDLARRAGVRARLDIVGHADSQGQPALSDRLSAARAEAVRQRLAALGVPALELAARGVGAREPMRVEVTAADREKNRGVSFDAHLPDGALAE